VKPLLFGSFCLIALSITAAKADFAGPVYATKAMSPDGNLLVRITLVKHADDNEEKPTYNVVFYKFGAAKEGYLKDSEFVLRDYLGQMMYVSNAGDLVIVSLGENEAVMLFSPEGKRLKAWNLDEFLTKEEISACAQTGSTLQWLEEASFGGRSPYFRGPSRVIRAMQASYTVMRGADEKISFSGILELKERQITKDEPEAGQIPTPTWITASPCRTVPPDSA
jgi:hypothetical protein